MVASPNNPTGAIVSRDHLLALCAAAPHAVVFVDEAYFHFHGETTLPDISRIPNLIVARTFSKAYGLANLRIGMLAGNPQLLGYIRKVSSPYNVNGVALDVLPFALEDRDYLNWYITKSTPAATASSKLSPNSASASGRATPTSSSSRSALATRNSSAACAIEASSSATAPPTPAATATSASPSASKTTSPAASKLYAKPSRRCSGKDHSSHRSWQSRVRTAG